MPFEKQNRKYGSLDRKGSISRTSANDTFAKDILLFLKMSGKLTIIQSSVIMQNDISRAWNLPDAPVLYFCTVYT